MIYITSIGVIHHYAELTFLSFIYFAESTNVGMVQNFQYLRLVQGLASFFFTHLGDVDLLDDGV